VAIWHASCTYIDSIVQFINISADGFVESPISAIDLVPFTLPPKATFLRRHLS